MTIRYKLYTGFQCFRECYKFFIFLIFASSVSLFGFRFIYISQYLALDLSIYLYIYIFAVKIVTSVCMVVFCAARGW